jgi:transglutaminase-like putative cysteine protease
MEMSPDDVALARARIAVLGAIAVLLALAASDIFDHRQWSLLLAPLIPTATALLTCPRPAIVRLVGAAGSVLLAIVLVVLLADGSSRDVLVAGTSGAQRLISTEWPSPATAELLGTAAVALAFASALAAELARHRRWHVLPTLPLLVVYVVIIAASAPGGVHLVWLLPIGLLAALFATLRPGAALGERATLLVGERRLVPLIVVAAIVAGLVSVPVSLTARADPRRYDAPDESAAILEPIEAMLAIRGIDPPQPLYRIEGDDAGTVPRWRAAALEEYDGRRWAPAVTIRPLGRTLGPVTGETVDVDVYFLDGDLALLPLPGSPVTVEALIQTDTDRTVVRIDENVSADVAVHVRSNVTPARSTIDPNSVVTREVDGSVSGLSDVAEALAQTGTLIEQLDRLEQRMRDNFVLDSQAPGGGLQRALIEYFLRETQRGNAEQFATAFVLLARALGVEARVATGFISEGGDEQVTLHSSDVAVWPEVLTTEGWIAFDPVPLEEASDAIPPPDEPSAQTPAAPQPPVDPPLESETKPDTEEATEPAGSSDQISGLAAWAGGIGLFLLLVAVPAAVAALLIAGAKRRRRRRRLSAPLPGDRVRGAWALATDALVDAGQEIDPSLTDTEIALGGGARVVKASSELERLAWMSSAATYGDPVEPDQLAVEAVACLTAVETALQSGFGRVRRLRWRLSLRSLRASTRSPVFA